MLSFSSLTRIRAVHHSVGMFLAFFLVVISLTGIALNHSGAMRLDERTVPAFIASRYYSTEDVSGYYLNDRHYYVIGGKLFIDRKEVSLCEEINGAIRIDDQAAVLCLSELLVFSSDHQFSERIGSSFGFPENVRRIASHKNQLLLGLGEDIYSFDVETLKLQPGPTDGGTVVWSEAGRVPNSLLLSESVSWQKFILDLHSGMFFGAGGIWLTDLVGVLTIAMAVSGLVMSIAGTNVMR